MLKKSLVVMFAATLGLTACGSLPSAINTSVSTASSGLSTLALDSATGTEAAPSDKPGRPGGQKGPGGHAGPGGFAVINPHVLASLDLTDAQKTEIEALQSEAKAFFEANKPAQSSESAETRQADMEAQRAAFEAAFKSDTFDPSSLSSKRPEPPVASDTILDFQVTQAVKLHDILTAEQRAQLLAEPAKPQNTPSARPSIPADAADRQAQRLEELSTELNLSDSQKTELQAIFADAASKRQSEMESRSSEMETQREALKALWTQDSLDSSALKALLKAQFAKAPAEDHLSQLVQIHDLLTAEQRVLWLDLNQAGPGFGPGPDNHGSKGHGGPGGGFGGPAGHGERPPIDPNS